MVRFTIVVGIYFLALHYLNAQPAIQWQNAIGGSELDEAYSIKQCTDHGYIICGATLSSDGDIPFNNGFIDYFLVKLHANGDKEWSKAFGGSDDDRGLTVCQTPDGGFLAAGFSKSNDGDVSTFLGERDAWLIKLDANGNLIWEKSFGGSKYDEIWSIESIPSGGYILAGTSSSTDGDLAGNISQYRDIWVIKISESGDIIWDKSYGGNSSDESRCIINTSDGGFILVGNTLSSDGDITSNNGDFDIWVVKLDADGNLLWQDTYGTLSSDYGYEIMEVADGYMVCGYVGGIGGDITNFNGFGDAWLFKISKTGTLLWQKTFGGTDGDWGRDISIADDGNYLLTGTTKSRDGDVSWYDGIQRMWVLKITPQGDILWQLTLGGSDGESCLSSEKTTDNGYVLAGYTWSEDGDVTSPLNGEGDFWIVKLSPESISPVLEHPLQPLSFAPNPAQNTLVYTLSNNETIKTVEIFDLTGKAVLTQLAPENNQVNIQPLPTGHYNIAVTTVAGVRFAGVFQKL
jgi:hypothetical protein